MSRSQEECVEDTLKESYPTHSFVPHSFPRTVNLVVILPPSGWPYSLPSHLRWSFTEGARDSARAACFWPFLPEAAKRPKTFQARSLPSEGERFQGRVFGFVFFKITFIFKKIKIYFLFSKQAAFGQWTPVACNLHNLYVNDPWGPGTLKLLKKSRNSSVPRLLLGYSTPRLSYRLILCWAIIG